MRSLSGGSGGGSGGVGSATRDDDGLARGYEPYQLLKAGLASLGRSSVRGRLGQFAGGDDEGEGEGEGGAFGGAFGEDLTRGRNPLRAIDGQSYVGSTRTGAREELGGSEGGSAVGVVTEGRGGVVSELVGGGGVVVDEGRREGMEREGKGRGGLGEGGAGEGGEGAYFRRFRFKWEGGVRADDDDDEDKDGGLSSFKCGVTFEGTDVFAGLKAMVETGLASKDVKPWVREAQGFGGGMVEVKEGRIVRKGM